MQKNKSGCYFLNTVYFSHAKQYGNTPTETPLTRACNARGYEKIAMFDQYLASSRNIIQDRAIVTMEGE